jgi:hypothetical protein
MGGNFPWDFPPFGKWDSLINKGFPWDFPFLSNGIGLPYPIIKMGWEIPIGIPY